MLESKKTSIYKNTNFDIVKISGVDATDLLHRITTNEIRNIKENEFLSTIFLNDKGRLIDIFQMMKHEDAFLGISSSFETLNEWIDKFVFMEKITVSKEEFTLCEVILGEGVTSLLNVDLFPGKVNEIEFEGHILYAFVEYSNHLKLIVPNGVIENVLKLDEFDEISSDVYAQWRINSLVGTIPNEFNDKYIPLEVGLVDHISFTKGCYIGQEIIARLDTYQKVTKYLAQIKTNDELISSDSYLVKNKDGKLLGLITTIGCFDQNGYYHLGVIHKSVCEEGTSVLLESQSTSKLYEATVDDVLTNKTYYTT